MPLNKSYWNYENAISTDWNTHGIKYANSTIYDNPNFTFGSLDLSFPTSFKKTKCTKIVTTNTQTKKQEGLTVDCIRYNAMNYFDGNNSRANFYKDNILTGKQAGDGYQRPVIDIDTHDFAFKMELTLFSNGNWITVNAVDFVNNYNNYAANVYGYISNYYSTIGATYDFTNYFDTGDSIFEVFANSRGYRTSGYGSLYKGGHAVSGQKWYNTMLWQVATTTGMQNYTNQDSIYNIYIPYEIPELNGQSWSGDAIPALMTGGTYTNHAVLVYSDQRVIMPLKHILRDIIVNCGLVLLDSNDVKYISMVDANGECQNKLVLLSSDEAKDSSIYNTRTSDNTLNPTGGGGGGDNENKEIDMPLAYIGGTGGFVQFIKINSAGLASADDISAALSRFDITTIGKDLLRNFVSYKCFAVINIDPDDTVTRQIKVGGHALTDENDQPLNGQVIGSVLPIDFEIGTPTRYFNDFRDYSPYTKIEAYVPFCGWFTLPSWCIGHKITGTMFTDLYNGTVKAVIFASQTVVAEIGGCCAYDIPFVADATGAKAGAVISSALSTAAAAAATVTMPNVATGIAAVTSAANTISAVNSNDTTLKGVLGDGSNLNGLLHCYLKVTRPQSPTRNNTIPYTYKHEIGIPTCKELKLASGDGFTQILDANIDGEMTDREKQMIIDGFKHGLIL